MELKDYLWKIREELIKEFIINQFSIPSYSHENNIEVGVSFEKCLEKFDFDHINQSFDKNYIKGDNRYKVTNEILEVKTISSNRTASNGRYKCNYKKKNGNNDGNLIKHLPHGLLFYQKFSLEEGYPAAIGFLTRNTLINIFSDEKRFINNDSNIYFLFYKADLTWFHEAKKIPKVNSRFYNEIADMEKRYKMALQNEKRECFYKNTNGDFVLCDRNEIQYPNARFVKSHEKQKIALIAKRMLDEGKTLFEVSKEVKINPCPTLEKWIKNLND